MAPSTPTAKAMFTTGQLAQLLEAELIGSAEIVVTELETLERASSHSLSFVRDAKYLRMWRTSVCGAAMVTRRVVEEAGGVEAPPGRAILVVEDADRALVRMLDQLTPPSTPLEGIDASASVDSSVSLGEAAAVGAQGVIGPGASIGARATIHSGCVIGANAVIGEDCVLHPNVVIYPSCEVGDRSVLHAGTVVGADGFGYLAAPDGKSLIKVPHIGNVIIGRDVEIGANSCVDRAKFGSTIVGDGTKIDNHVQIGHGCRIGRGCILCGLVGLAGSVNLGDGVTLAGFVGVGEGLTVGEGSMVAAKSGVMKNIGPGETWFGCPARPAISIMRQIGTIEKLADMLPALRRIMKDQPGGR